MAGAKHMFPEMGKRCAGTLSVDNYFFFHIVFWTKSTGDGLLWIISSCCLIVDEKLAAALTNTSKVSLAHAERSA
jgi:hypothetical protein